VPNEYQDDHQSRTGRASSPYRRQGGGHGERRGIPLSDLDPTTTESSRRVIGCSIEVHKNLGPGFSADVYMNALKRELDACGVKYKSDHKVPVRYKDHVVGEVSADLFVDNLFLVCVTARPGPVGTPERMCLRGQLKAANLDLGLIINFSERRLKDGLVRVLNIDKINHDRGGDLTDEDGPDGGDRAQDFDAGH
jgi:GxxExxY protein